MGGALVIVPEDSVLGTYAAPKCIFSYSPPSFARPSFPISLPTTKPNPTTSTAPVNSVGHHTVTDFCLDFLFQPQPSADAITRLKHVHLDPCLHLWFAKGGVELSRYWICVLESLSIRVDGPFTRSMMIPPRLPTGSVPSSTPPRTIRPAPTAIPDIITAINEVITKPPKCYFTCLAAEGIVFPFTSIKSVDDALAFCKFISDFNPPQEVLIKASQCAAKDPVCLASLIGMNEDMVDVDETCENLYTLQGGNSGVAVTGLPATLTRATNVAGSTVASSSVTNSSKVSAAGKGQEPSILVMGLVGLAATMFLL
ncbi:hypothetical protein BC829DRAFT_446779 [Chytridium lagenaria]|nr:hypothetical protein BC829DRAFT_446779 [Chytridium lagenaria]